MAQFGGAKNPPWARDPASSLVLPVNQQGVAGLGQPQVGLANTVLTQPGIANPTVYSLGASQPTVAPNQYAQQMGVAQMQNAGPPPNLPPNVLSQVAQMQPGIAMPTTLATTQVATISYPTPRGTSGGQQQQPPAKQQRVFTGTVTKLHDNFGFVDEDVFFQTSCVKGIIPKVGDRVLVEAAYNANMPFKWNAARIQVLPNQPVVPQSQGSFNNVPNTFAQAPISYQVKPGMGPTITPSVITPTTLAQPPPLMGQQTQPAGPKRDKGLLQAPAGRQNLVPRGRMDGGYRDRDRPRDRDRHSGHERRERRSPRKRSRSPRRSKSPSARPRSPQRRRAPARIVPRYMVQIPKLSLDVKEANVMALRSRYSNLYIPSDFFNSKFSWVDAFPLHRNFQLGNPCTFHIMSKDVESLTKAETAPEPSDADHLFSAKVMLLSTPQLDDIYHKSCALTEDTAELRESFQHPTRLIQFLVGMKGKSEPMAIGGPWSPSMDGPNPADDPRVLINTAIRTTKALTGVDLSSCTQWYRFTEIRYHRPEEMHKGRLVPARVETVVIFLPDVWSCSPSRLDWEQMQTAYIKQLQDKLAEENKEDSQEDYEEALDGEEVNKTPTHYAELDPKNMKVTDLRKELEARTLSSKGLKSQLIARLTKALKSEQEKEEQDEENKEDQEDLKLEEEKRMEVDEKEEEQKKKEEEERRKKEEREKLAREKKFALPENPAILVHPSPTAKAKKFECTVMSLSVLLDYRPEDTKEHSFEVSLFAELFNEMLMRDFGYEIFKALLCAPEPKKEEKDSKEKENKEKESKEKDSKEKDSKEEKEKDKEKDSSEEPSEKKRKTSEEEEENMEEKTDKESPNEKKEIKEEPKEEKEDDKEEDKRTNVDDENMEEEADDSKEKEPLPLVESTGSVERDRPRSKEREKERDKDKEKKREKVKYCSMFRRLLLAFVYFDQSHTGYLLDKDVEEILHTLGLQLSRAQIKKLVQKLVSRDTLNYRKLTDRPQVKEPEKEGEVKVDTDEDAPQPDPELLLGNVPFLHKKVQATPSTESLKLEVKQEPASSADNFGFVMYNGAMIDINSVMQRLEKSEKTRTTVEDKLKNVQEEMESLKTNYTSSEQNGQKVAQELLELKKKLRDQKRQTETVEGTVKKYTDVLNRSKSMLTSLMGDIKDVMEPCQLLRKEDIKQEPVNGQREES